MSYPKLKSESYRNLGGINNKLSPYETGPHQFLDISNFDFQTPGALTKRWGSTMYIGQTFAAPVTDIYEFAQTTGFSQLIVGHTGGLWAGATTGQLTGISLGFQSTTLSYTGAIFTVNGGGFVLSLIPIMFWQDDPEQGLMWPSIYRLPAMTIKNYYDFIVQNNYLYGSDGSRFVKYTGTTLLSFDIFPVASEIVNATKMSGASLASPYRIPLGNTGAIFWASYLTQTGVEGPIFPIAYADVSLTSILGATLNSILTAIGAPGSSIAFTLNTTIQTPGFLGLSGINIYGSAINYGFGGGFSLMFETPFTFIYTAPRTSDVTTVALGWGHSFTFLNDRDMFDNTYPIGFTFTPIQPGDIGSTLFPSVLYPELYTTPDKPKYLETHIGRVFYSGIASDPNKVLYSEIGKAEITLPENSFNVITNNGDIIRGLKSFGQKFYIFKTDSFHVLTGDNPDNFTLLEVSLEYGCLSNRAIAVFDDIMLFLDRRGIVRFDGANLTIISEPIESIFNRMTIDSAIDKATMIHDKLRTEILIGIPVDGSTVNNLTIVYDYTLNAWTTYAGYLPATLAVVRGRLRDQTAFYGSYSGIVANFGQSYLSDNGVAFTCMAQSRFLADMGETTQQMFRRLWLNVQPIAGATAPIGLEFYKDYDTAISLTRVMYQTPFQNRIDYGISAKALSVKFTQISATLPCKIFGYGIASRYLRDV